MESVVFQYRILQCVWPVTHLAGFIIYWQLIRTLLLHDASPALTKVAAFRCKLTVKLFTHLRFEVDGVEQSVSTADQSVPNDRSNPLSLPQIFF